ncbi:MAG: transposase, partial [Sphingobacteriaceae bacterium]
MFENKEGYKSEHVILDKKNYERDLKGFSFTFIELPKFKKKIEDLNSYEDKWCYFFKHSNNVEEIKKMIDQCEDKTIGKAYDVLASYHWSEIELNTYEKIKKMNLDAQARERYIIEESRRIALIEGMEKGMEKGRDEGRVEILEMVVRKMIASGMNKELIIQITGFNMETID